MTYPYLREKKLLWVEIVQLDLFDEPSEKRELKDGV